MKKISLFSFLAAALLCIGQNAMAQTMPNGIFSATTDEQELNKLAFGTDADVHYNISNNTIVFSAFDLYKSSKITWQASKNGGTSSRTWDEADPFKGSSYYHTTTTAKCVTAKDDPTSPREYTYRFTNAEFVSIYGKPSSKKPLAMNVYEIVNGSASSEPAFSASSESNTIQKSTKLDPKKEYVLSVTTSATSNVDLYEVAFECPAPTSDPYFNISPKSVELNVTPFAKSVETSVAIKGGNLTDGNYDLTLPTVEGLTIAPTSVTVTDGALDATITLTYTSETNVEKATAEASLTIGELTEKLTINYSANVDLLEQTTVSENTTWDWTKASANKILLDGNTAPKKNDTIVLANIDGIANNADFNSQALLVSGEYMVRDSKFFQGGYISFTTEKQGFVTVEFSHTSDTKPERFLNINSVKTSFSSKASKTNTISDAIAVPAGKVEITFADETANQYARVYKITYTIDNTETSIDQAEVSAKAVKVVRDGQLYILRDGKTYTAQGIVVE